MERNKKKIWCNLFISFFLSVCITLGTAVYVGIIEVFGGELSIGNIFELIRRAIYNPKYIIMFGAVFLILILVIYKGEFFSKQIYKYRFIIAAFLFAVCVLLEINGSSVGMWSSVFGETDSDIIFGVSRSIRTDEWAVSTPMALSQYYDAAGPFSYFSHVVRGTATDVFLEYGQPVRDIAILFRPFHWGYLFLSPGKALAFYWCGRYICLFLVSFEFGRLLTNDKKGLAAAFGMLVLFAPVVQWWFAINGLVEMLIFMQLSILMLVKYMRTASYRIRLLCIGVIIICAGGYVFTMYPAWMIPIAYILLGLAIWVFWEYAKDCRMRKADWLMILAGILLFGILSGYIFLKSKDTILAIMNTAYPGKRFATGGKMKQGLCNYMSNIWYAMRGNGTGANVCESAQFIDFFPMCYVLPVLVIWKGKIRDKLLCTMLPVSVFLGIWITLGFPKFIAKYTLMSYTTDFRAVQVIGLANLILIFRSLALMQRELKSGAAVLIAAGIGVPVVHVGRSINEQFFGKLELGGMLFIFIAAFYLMLRISKENEKNIFVICCCVIALTSGLLVNPIRRGVDNIYELEIVKNIQEIHAEDPEALWISEGLEFPLTEISIVTGAPTVNSTNVYPAKETWRKVDPDGKYEKKYNRYAHITTEIKEEGSAEFELFHNWPDWINIKMTVEDLKRIGVKYILTNSQFDAEEESKYQLMLLDTWKEYRIYQVR